VALYSEIVLFVPYRKHCVLGIYIISQECGGETCRENIAFLPSSTEAEIDCFSFVRHCYILYCFFLILFSTRYRTSYHNECGYYL